MTRHQRTLALASAHRQAATESLHLKRGMFILAATATTGPLLGCLAALEAILTSFQGITGEKYAIYFATVRLLCRVPLMVALGLFIGLAARSAWLYLESQLDAIQRETQQALAHLLTNNVIRDAAKESLTPHLKPKQSS